MNYQCVTRPGSPLLSTNLAHYLTSSFLCTSFLPLSSFPFCIKSFQGENDTQPISSFLSTTWARYPYKAPFSTILFISLSCFISPSNPSKVDINVTPPTPPFLRTNGSLLFFLYPGVVVFFPAIKHFPCWISMCYSIPSPLFLTTNGIEDRTRLPGGGTERRTLLWSATQRWWISAFPSADKENKKDYPSSLTGTEGIRHRTHVPEYRTLAFNVVGEMMDCRPFFL